MSRPATTTQGGPAAGQQTINVADLDIVQLSEVRKQLEEVCLISH